MLSGMIFTAGYIIYFNDPFHLGFVTSPDEWWWGISPEGIGAVGMVLERVMPDHWAAAIGFLFVFLGIAVVFSLTGWLLRKLLQGLSLGWLDQLLGAFVGLLRAAILVGGLALVVEGLGSFGAATNATTYPYALESGRLQEKTTALEPCYRFPGFSRTYGLSWRFVG